MNKKILIIMISTRRSLLMITLIKILKKYSHFKLWRAVQKDYLKIERETLNNPIFRNKIILFLTNRNSTFKYFLVKIAVLKKRSLSIKGKF
jgi:hypothetical protein